MINRANQNLSAAELAAIHGATSPSGTNPMATDDELAANAAADASETQLSTHAGLTTGTHGVGASTVESAAGAQAKAAAAQAAAIASAAVSAVQHSAVVPAEGVLRKTGAGTYTAIKSNLGAGVDPTATDDNNVGGVGLGYVAGSLWLNTATGRAFQCVSPAVGAAVWSPMLLTAEQAGIVAALGGPLAAGNPPITVAGTAPLGRKATNHIRVKVNALDADACTITVGGIASTYEFDSGGGVVPGNIPVVIGGTAADSATNLKAAITANQSAVLTAANPDADRAIQLRAVVAGATLVVTETTAGARLRCNPASEVGIAPLVSQSQVIRRLVTAEDVDRLAIVIDTGFTIIDGYILTFYIATWSSYDVHVPHALLTITGGVIRIPRTGAGSLSWVAGDYALLSVQGR